MAKRPREASEVQRHLAEYYGMISHLDECVGQILDTVDEEGIADETIVVYTADHGLAVGQHGLFGKQNLYDHSMRVPLIVRGPGVAAGTIADTLCYQHDLNPTLLHAAGVTVPEHCDFASLAPALTDAAGTVHEQVFASMQLERSADPATPHQRMIRRGDRKLIHTAGDGVEHWQLFDIARDPLETHNLAGDPEMAGSLRQLQGLLSDTLAGANDPMAQAG